MSSFSPVLFTILVVDDDAIGRMLLMKILEKEGYVVDAADSGIDALKKIEKQKYDMLLLDIVMPDIDGIQVLLKLREMGLSNSMPVIMLTGKSSHESKREAFDLGAVDYITKPFYDYDVNARVRVHLKNLYNAQLLVEQQTAHLLQVEKIKQSISIDPQSLPEARFSVLHESLKEIGGDFYDVIALTNNITFYSVADASGHDIGTSYLAPAYKALLRQNVSVLYTPAETMQMINRVLCGVFDDERYVTAVSLIINRDTGKVQWSSAGHPPPLLIRKNRKPRFLEGKGFVMGVFAHFSYDSHATTVQKGDKIVLFSDGLVERDTGVAWTEFMQEVLDSSENLSAVSYKDIPKVLYDAMEKARSKPDDDVTILAIEV